MCAQGPINPLHGDFSVATSRGTAFDDLDNDGDYDLVNGSTWSQANPSRNNPAPDNVFENDGNAMFYCALGGYNSGNLDAAQERLERAIDLKNSEHKFFQLRGLIAERHGDRKAALESFEQALDLAVYSDARRMYDSKISLLSGTR